MTDIEKIKRIVKVIKKRFTNMTVEETLDFAGELIEALEST